jgi:small-conductance mechanosensitive channel
LIILLSIIAGLQLFGFNLSVLVAGSAALCRNWFRAQNLLVILFLNFTTLDSSVKVNDVIELNGMVCTVQEINFTNNGPLTRDDKYIILPQF